MKQRKDLQLFCVICTKLFTTKKILVFLLMCLCLIIVGKLTSYVPKQWTESDLKHIVKVISHWQNFPLMDHTISPSNVSIPFTEDLKRQIDMSYIGHHTNFYIYKIDNEKSDIKGLDSITELETFLNFQPLMSTPERQAMLYIFHVFIETCKKFNLTYFAIEGTILGIYRHGGFIPWDDDVDVIMDSSQWQKIRDIFSGIKQLSLITDNRFQWKIFAKDFGKKHNEDDSFKWPFLDIFFFEKDETHLWGLTPSLKPHFLYKLDDIFPLVTRDFENLEVFAPKRLNEFVTKMYDVNKCVTSVYLHKRDTWTPQHMMKTVPCSFLYNLYPFVFRHEDSKSNQIIEELKVGSVVLKKTNYKKE